MSSVIEGTSAEHPVDAFDTMQSLQRAAKEYCARREVVAKGSGRLCKPARRQRKVRASPNAYLGRQRQLVGERSDVCLQRSLT